MRRLQCFVASQVQYVNHVSHTWLALPDEYKGNFYTRPNSQADLRARSLGIKTTRTRDFKKGELVLVAGYEDYRITRLPDIVFWNHGVGMTYYSPNENTMFSAYSGGKFRDRTVMFVGPSHRDAENSRAAYPGTPCYAIGVPYLDSHWERPRPMNGPVCYSTHADIFAVSETRSAWNWIKGAVKELQQNGTYNLVGHCHPRVRRKMEPWYQKVGIPYEPDFWKILDVASCFIQDNSSTQFETAAIGIPNVVLNPPWYRRDVHHGLRFWSHIPGIEVNDPSELASSVNLALEDGPDLRRKREDAVMAAYSDAEGNLLIDGHATERGVAALIEACRG